MRTAVSPVTENSPYLRIKEAQDRYRVSHSHLYSLAKDGKITLRKLGGRTLIAVAEMEKLLQTGDVA
jgi:excisionase family DNA binding protein